MIKTRPPPERSLIFRGNRAKRCTWIWGRKEPAGVDVELRFVIAVIIR
jgi:hypothetical protein